MIIRLIITVLLCTLLSSLPSWAVTCRPNRTRTVAASAPIPPRVVPPGFSVSIIARLPSPRHLTFLPSGDLIVGTSTLSVYIVTDADTDNVGTPQVYTNFASADELSANGVIYANGSLYVGTQYSVWRIPVRRCALTGVASKIASIRQGSIAPTSDGNVHRTTSVGVTSNALLVAAGSSCNACPEVDPTRAAIQTMNRNGTNMRVQARRWRNPIAMATSPRSGALWAGGAGQDSLPRGHPYEFMDHVSTRPLNSDYGWPDCEENRTAYTSGANCSNVVVPTIILPAYSTIIGAVFYPIRTTGRTFRFPSTHREGMFISLRGSWHRNTDGTYAAPPRVVFVPFSKRTHMPARKVSWGDPTAQWTDFLTGLQDSKGKVRYGRTTGIAVGPNGSLFVADDQNEYIYRIRPNS
jgi:glucose/arabinose dehydrogenase